MVDYEKEYKRAKMRCEWQLANGLISKECASDLFRELYESEDERIRKWIVNFIEVRLPDAEEFEPEYRAALAYLEKQKDEVQKQFNLGVQAGREEAMYEMEKEQKPAEWSLTDATFIEEIDETLFMAETGRNEVVKNQIERERNWLKSLPERFNPQPKQEWSEEDE